MESLTFSKLGRLARASSALKPKPHHHSYRSPISQTISLPLNRTAGVRFSAPIVLRPVGIYSSWTPNLPFSTKSSKARAKALVLSSDEEDEVYDDETGSFYDGSETEDDSDVEDGVPGSLYAEVYDPFIHKASFGQLLQYIDMLKEKAEMHTKSTGIGMDYIKKEDEKGLYLWVSMPGIGKEDVKISFEKDKLTMKGESQAVDDSVEKYKYCKKVYISSEIFKVTDISAEMKNGILKVVVPKIKEEEKDVVRISVN